MGTGADDEQDSGAAFELAAGCVAVLVAAFTAAALSGPGEQVARSVVMAIGAALLAVVLRDWRSTAGVTVLAALVFVGFLAHQAGQLTGDPAPWRYTLIIGVAALLGRGIRSLRAAVRHRASRPWAPTVPPLRRRGDRSAAATRPASARS